MVCAGFEASLSHGTRILCQSPAIHMTDLVDQRCGPTVLGALRRCFPVHTPDRAMRTSHHHGLKEPFEHRWDTARAFFESYFCEVRA